MRGDGGPQPALGVVRGRRITDRQIATRLGCKTERYVRTPAASECSSSSVSRLSWAASSTWSCWSSSRSTVRLRSSAWASRCRPGRESMSEFVFAEDKTATRQMVTSQ